MVSEGAVVLPSSPSCVWCSPSVCVVVLLNGGDGVVLSPASRCPAIFTVSPLCCLVLLVLFLFLFRLCGVVFVVGCGMAVVCAVFAVCASVVCVEKGMRVMNSGCVTRCELCPTIPFLLVFAVIVLLV